MAGERAHRAAEKLKIEKWLVTEAMYKAHERLPSGNTVLGNYEVSDSVGSMLWMIGLHWRDLPEQVRHQVLKTAHKITNHGKPRKA